MLQILRHNVTIKSGLMTSQHLQVPQHEVPILMRIHKGEVIDLGPCDPPIVFEFESIEMEYARMGRRYRGNTESDNGTLWVDEAYGNPVLQAFGDAIKKNLISIGDQDTDCHEPTEIPKDLEKCTRKQLFAMISGFGISAGRAKTEELISAIAKAKVMIEMGCKWEQGIALQDFIALEVMQENQEMVSVG